MSFMRSSSPLGSPLRNLLEASAFLAPFISVYLLFLVYPFIQSIWVSLHDWNLMAVAFNPDARTFIGLDNYIRLFWGRNMEWGFATRPIFQGLSLFGAVAAMFYWHKSHLTGRVALIVVLLALGFYIFFGWAPGEGGRWNSRTFWDVVANTLTFVFITVPAIVVISLTLAVFLNRETRIASFLRTLFFLSQILSVTVVTLIWQLLFSSRQGLIAHTTTALGGTPLSWLTEPGFAMAAIIIATVWWSIGIAMVLFLSGLQAIPEEMQEAAKLDRANSWQTFWYILLPNLKRTVTLVVVLQIIMHFQVFGQAHLMTAGGPGGDTQTLVREIYLNAFRDGEMGMASAVAVFLFVIIAAFSALQFLISKEDQ